MTEQKNEEPFLLQFLRYGASHRYSRSVGCRQLGEQKSSMGAGRGVLTCAETSMLEGHGGKVQGHRGRWQGSGTSKKASLRQGDRMGVTAGQPCLESLGRPGSGAQRVRAA